MRGMLKVVVVDTGIDCCYKNEHIVGGVTIAKDGEGCWIKEGYKDSIGHGTGTVDLILRNTDNAEIYEVKVYDEDIYISSEKLCYALKYISQNLDFDLIQVSSGITTYSGELHDIVREIVCAKGKCIISAFDNEGAISYPAAFEEVIGVDINPAYSKKEMFDIVEGNVIDIRGADIYHRMAFLDGRTNITKGSSFLTSCFTALIANMQIERLDKKTILSQLKEKANRVYKDDSKTSITAYRFVQKIERAVVFPFNKEIHSIATFEDMLSFEVVGYYDIKHKFLVGKKICEILRHTTNEKEIRNIENLNWEAEFDTVICGHVGEIEKILKKDIVSELIEKCMQYGKRIFFLDDLGGIWEEYRNSEQIFSASFMEKKEVNNRFGKLRMVNKPVLAVLGTSSKQGKFSIQLSLMRELKERGYVIDGVGTEPTSIFFGYTEMFPFGYGTNANLSGRAMVHILNEMVWQIEKENVDLVLTGCQSGTITYEARNESMLAIEQYNFLLGVNPDGIILCVNEIDELNYIEKTIGFGESIGCAKVIAIIVSETHNLFSYSVFGRRVTTNTIITREMLSEKIQVQVFSLSSLDVMGLTDIILEYYE